MSQDFLSQDHLITAQPGTPRSAGAKKTWPKVLGCIGGGCLVTLLCLGVGIVGLYFSGVLSGTHGNLDDMPAWSPDGNRILFVSNRDGYSDLYMMDTDGSNVRQLTRDRIAVLYLLRSPTDSWPAWSPDGQKIVFSSGRDNGMMTYIDLNIYMMNADGSHVVRLSYDDTVEIQPAWSPDGEKIAFVSYGSPFNGWTRSIFLTDPDASFLVQLTQDTDDGYGIAWSPDSRYLLFVSNQNSKRALYKMNIENSSVVQLTSLPVADMRPAWSSDGSRIAFVVERGDKHAICSMNADGSDIVQLTSDYTDAYHPSWSPDGNRLAFVMNNSGDTDIYTMNADGADIVNITGK